MPIWLMAYGRNILLFCLIFMLSSVATNLISYPVWSTYIISLGASMTELGFVFSTSEAVSAVLQIPSGMLSDRYGRKKLHALGTLIGVFPPLFYTLARGWIDLIPWVVLSGVSIGLYLPIRWSIPADASTEETRASAYSWTNVAFLLGSTVGPLLGGVIADIYNIKAPFLVCFALLSVNFPLTLLLQETGRRNAIKIVRRSEEPPKIMSFSSVIVLFSLTMLYKPWVLRFSFPFSQSL